MLETQRIAKDTNLFRSRHRRLSVRFAYVMMSICGLSLVSGCGGSEGPTGKVTGNVVNNNKPMPPIVVTLYDSQLVPAGTASVSSDGKFEFEMPVPFGTYTATLMPVSEVAAGDEDPGLAQAAATIPQQLRDPSASPFKVTIDEEEETVELKLQ